MILFSFILAGLILPSLDKLGNKGAVMNNFKIAAKLRDIHS